MAKKPKKASPVATAAMVALILGPLAGWLAYQGVEERRLAAASEPSTCSVLGAGTEAWSQTDADGSPQGDGYVPWIVLVHTIAGERFERRDEGPSSDTEPEAARLVADVSPGQEVPCRYVAGDPSLVVYFERDAGPGNLKLMGAGAFLLGILATIGWAVFRRRRA